MDIPNIKGLVQKLSIFKNNVSLLASTILAVVGVLILILTPLLLGSKLGKQIERESISKGQSAKNINAVAREQWEVEREYQKSYESDANEIARLAKQSTQRELLLYGIFPEPKEKSQFIFEGFGRRFRQEVEGLIGKVKAKDCPTDSELKRIMESSRSGLRPGVRRPSTSAAPPGRSLIGPYMRLGAVDSTIVDEICSQRAESASVYANPIDLSGYELWSAYQYTGIDEAVRDCWYWQLGYWVIEDVIDTIAACNSESNSVFTSPVKRLLSTSFSLGRPSRDKRPVRRVARRRFGPARKSDEDKPSYVASSKDGLAESCTGRLCNDDIDVIHFNVAVVVSAEAVLPFMDQLCSVKQHKFSGFSGQEQAQWFKHNQISILESSWTAVDRESAAHRFYRYGDDAVVELDLICEYVFNKSGYEEIKPESVKKSVQATDEKTIR